VGAGTSLWFAGLSYAVSRGHGRFTEKTLLRMEHGSGIIQGIYIVIKISRNRL
jgi:hypothetical protein